MKLLLQPPRPLQPFFFDFSIAFLGLLLNEGFPGLFEAIVRASMGVVEIDEFLPVSSSLILKVLVLLSIFRQSSFLLIDLSKSLFDRFDLTLQVRQSLFFLLNVDGVTF